MENALFTYESMSLRSINVIVYNECILKVDVGANMAGTSFKQGILSMTEATIELVSEDGTEVTYPFHLSFGDPQ